MKEKAACPHECVADKADKENRVMSLLSAAPNPSIGEVDEEDIR